MIARSTTARQRCALLAVIGTACLLVGCEEPQPISFAEFMDDDIARDGTLARCNEDREATLSDIECANARRAAAAIALREERARREALELESERRLAELRREVERERAAAQEAQRRAEAAARAAYDAQWQSADSAPVGIDGQPIDQAQSIGLDGMPIEPGTNNVTPGDPMPSDTGSMDPENPPGPTQGNLPAEPLPEQPVDPAQVAAQPPQ